MVGSCVAGGVRTFEVYVDSYEVLKLNEDLKTNYAMYCMRVFAD